MAATDYELLIYQRLKAILLAHAPLTTAGPTYILPGDWVWYDGTQDDPESLVRVPTSYPRLALEPAGRTEEHWEARPRYGDHDVDATPASLSRKVLIVFNFTVRLTHGNLRLTVNSPLEAEVMRALRGSNPTLSIPGSPQTDGYPWVLRWGPLAVARTMGLVEGDTSGMARMQSVFTIPVTTVFNSGDLLT